MSAPNTLETAALDRKARLAQLKSLKRKAPPSEPALAIEEADGTLPIPSHDNDADAADADLDASSKYLSGRNYDISTRGPRLGFESVPAADVETIEAQAARLAQAEKAQREQDARADQPLDLFKLQPKKPNWDLKRELDRRLERVNVRTDNAIARIVRERVESQREKDGGMGGGELVSGVRALEEEGRREGQDED